MEVDAHYRDHPSLFILNPNPDELSTYVQARTITHVVAHTLQYFEQMSTLSRSVKRWVWEHGDPSPELFPKDFQKRTHIVENKRRHVYPHVDKVIAISGFIREDIGWPMAQVIYNGCDHVPQHEPSCAQEGPLKVGTLMRLGSGERFYKGGDLYIQLAEQLKAHKGRAFSVMGRGTERDAAEFRKAGIDVHLNGTYDERSEFLKRLDVFVSPSMWEGFNLPLVEAQMSGTLSIAFDIGAHPEVTPFVVSDLSELTSLLHALDTDRDMLLRYAVKAHDYCRRKFSWGKTVSRVKRLLVDDC